MNEGIWWIASHPVKGFSFGFGADGGAMLRVYDELDRDLIEDIKELNEDDIDKRWKAVKVTVEVME